MLRQKISYLFTKSGFYNFLGSLLLSLGSFWLMIEFPSFLFPEFHSYVQSHNNNFALSTLALAFIYASLVSLPKTKVTKCFPASNTIVCIKVGDLLSEDCNIAIGSNNYFDSGKGGIPHSSITSQIIIKFYNSDYTEFFKDYKNAIEGKAIKGTYEPKKDDQYNVRYPAGTTILVRPESHKKSIFLVVIAELIYNQGRHSQTNDLMLIQGFDGLWKTIRKYGRLEEISVPVFGSGMAGSNLSHLLLLQTIILSYCKASKYNRVTEKLNIVVHKKNYDAREFDEIDKFLNSISI